jgi:anti-sigma regulatory factor (Ser/Thr protein kinase)
MSRKSRENPEIRAFILQQIDSHSRNIASLTIKRFGLSRASANGYLRRLINEGIIEGVGNTKARHYSLKRSRIDIFTLRLSPAIEEHVVWQYRILPHLKKLNVKQNILEMWEYSFTEMLNNAIDHSASAEVEIALSHTHDAIDIWVMDTGIGIFEKIQRDFKLADPRSALLELSKGKLTSDPKHHSGEGIFYTSRMLDEFSIRSGRLFYLRERQKEDDWLIETHDLLEYHKGTAIWMKLSMNATWTWRDVFARFEGDHMKFRKTHVPISLGQYAGESLISRSQAKRILSRFDRFSEVLLDFKGVKTIGQGFADEIFRVFKHSHPDVEVVAVNTTPAIKQMIEYVQANTPAKD